MIRLKNRAAAIVPVVITAAIIFSGLPEALAGDSPVDAALAQARQQYINVKLPEAMDTATACLDRGGLSANDLVRLYAFIGMCKYAEEKNDEAFAYLKRIIELNPCRVPDIIELPFDEWHQALKDRYCRMAYTAGCLNCEVERDPTIKTVAVMEFTVAAANKELQEDFVYLVPGLRDFFNDDLEEVTDITVVNRNNLNALLDELHLSRTSEVDPAAALNAGRILGAQYMVFGTAFDGGKRGGRLSARVFNVETTEQVASVSVESKKSPDFFAMEKELAVKLAEKLETAVDKEAKKRIEANRTQSAKASAEYAQGVYFANKYENGKAYQHFKKAYEIDSKFSDAKEKMEIYRSFGG